MQSTTTLKGYEKNAWTLLVALGVVAIILSFFLFAGISFDDALFNNQFGQSPSSFATSNPTFWSGLQYQYYQVAAALLGFAVLGIVLAYTAFRKGEKWAWYGTWYVALFLLWNVYVNYVAGGTLWMMDSVLFVISLAALLLPFRMFFPKK